VVSELYIQEIFLLFKFNIVILKFEVVNGAMSLNNHGKENYAVKIEPYESGPLFSEIKFY
jgi:hypothetical protein